MTRRLSFISPLLLGVSAAVVAVVIGALLGYTGILITIIALIGLAGVFWALSDMEVGMWGIVAIITLLPFATLPVKIVFTPTFLDLAMGGVLCVYLMQWMSGRRYRLTVTPAHAPILAFIVMAVFAFVAGLNNGPLTSNLARHFAEFTLSIAFSFVVVDWIDSREKLARIVGVIVLCGAAAALIGIALYAIPESLAERLLSALRVVGYPSGGVLQYIESNPELGQRAIGTSVNPNAFGGLLAIVGALAAPQVAASRPVFGPRWRWLWATSFLVIVICLILTFSRMAMAGLVLAMIGIAAARYRRLLGLVVIGAAVVIVLPFTQDYVLRFVAGAQGADLATQMRFGEYKDALILLSRYPVIGVGFSGTPDIDIYLGVSNAYLSIAQQMGFVGLAILLLILIVVFGWAFDHRRKAYADPLLEPLFLGSHAALVAALVVGLGDHYFVNLDFQPAQTLFWMIIGLGLSATGLSRTSAQIAPVV
ncbi:MAG TPA: O-antigen ligase family protein [Anaerolineales bacterium]|nr:O-antigen ligase family protein [Anaerolineales bacterium]